MLPWRRAGQSVEEMIAACEETARGPGRILRDEEVVGWCNWHVAEAHFLLSNILGRTLRQGNTAIEKRKLAIEWQFHLGDYFQRVFPNNFQHSWPSLFIGADGTQSDMHIDSGATNFWLFLLSGEKKWRFFDYDEILNLYPIRQTQKFKVDVFDPNYAEFPLYSRAKLYEGIQRPGDLMFIPGGCPP